jgi:glutamine amidotransferase
MLFERSEEGDTPGLGLLPGRVRRFPAERMVDPGGGRLKVPHMGWNEVEQVGSHPLWQGIPQGSRFYFVHSYYADPGAREATAGVSTYGLQFACAVARDNLFAVQFHPEKSQAAGLRLLSNFIAWQPVYGRAPRTIARRLTIRPC